MTGNTAGRRSTTVGIVAATAVVLLLVVGVLVATNRDTGTTPATAASGQPAEPEPTATEPELSPEEQAQADIEATYVAWSSAIDQAWRTGGDPVAARAPYVAGQFAEDTAQGLQDYQATGFVITGGAKELQRFEVTELDLTADPPTALADYCYSDTREYVLNGQAGALDSIYWGTHRYEQRDSRWVIVESLESNSEEDVSTSGKTC